MIKGLHQIHGFYFCETFSPWVKSIIIRTILIIVVSYGWKLFQLDVNNAFLNGFLKEMIYMTQPLDFETHDKSFVCKLNKTT